MEKLVVLLKTVGDEKRLRILLLVREAGDLCSCEIESILGLHQSNTSRHLHKLRQAGLVEHYKKAQWVHYRIPTFSQEFDRFLEPLLSAASEKAEPQTDRMLLEDYRKKGYTCQSVEQWVTLERPKLAP